MTLLLPQDQIEEQMLMLQDWELEENDIQQLTKQFEFENTQSAFDFVKKLETISLEIGQTPDILIHSNAKFVELMIVDYEYEGITQKCLDLALAIDVLE